MTLGGYEVTTIPSNERGLVDLAALKAALGPDVAGIMLTNPNTLGLFEEEIVEIAAAVHEVGGLLYYDGANLNAILGVIRPGDMGFDIVHMNLHKTFATPHGGGGPGCRSGRGVAAAGGVPARSAGPRAATGGGYYWSTPATLDRSRARVARQRHGARARARLHRRARGRGSDSRRPARRLECELAARAPA